MKNTTVEDVPYPPGTHEGGGDSFREDQIDWLSDLSWSQMNLWFEVAGLLWATPLPFPHPTNVYGSFGEGTATDLYTGDMGQGPELLEDVDMMFVMKDILAFQMVSHDSHPGFTQLDFELPENYEEGMEEGEETSRDYREALINLAQHSTSKLIKIWGNMPRSSGNPKLSGFYDAKSSGPARNMSGPSEYKGMEKVSLDVVMAIEGPTPWPGEAEEWKTRPHPSGWPSPAQIEHVTNQSGFMLVPVAHPRSKAPESEWRMSFSEAERFLILGLNKCQKNCYMLAKLLVKKAFKGWRLLSTYHVKTMFLWMLEEFPLDMWRIDRVGVMVCNLLDRLILAVAKGNLPGYFTPANNLIDAFPREHQKTILMLLQKVRQKPLDYLVYSLQHVFCLDDDECSSLIERLHPEDESEEEAFVEYCHHIKNAMYLRGQRAGLAGLTYGPAIEVLKKLAKVEHWSEGKCSDLHQLLQFKDVQVELDAYQVGIEFDPAAFFCALASHFRVEFYKASDAMRKKDLYERARFLFDKSLSAQEELPDVGLITEYAAFLYDAECYEEAKQLLGKECRENVCYSHFVANHGYLPLPSSFFCLWLKFNLALAEGEEVDGFIEQYKVLLENTEEFQDPSILALQEDIMVTNTELTELIAQRSAKKAIDMNMDVEELRKDMMKTLDSHQNIMNSRMILLHEMYEKRGYGKLGVGDDINDNPDIRQHNSLVNSRKRRAPVYDSENEDVAPILPPKGKIQ